VNGQPWSPADDATLRHVWLAASHTRLCKILGREWSHIWSHAMKLRLPAGVPDMICLDQATRVAGFSPHCLRRILVRWQVPMHRHPRPNPRRMRARRAAGERYYVDPHLVERAVRLELQRRARQETLVVAAKRLRISDVTLGRLARDAGWPVRAHVPCRLRPSTWTALVRRHRAELAAVPPRTQVRRYREAA
jgi:hypothetical protein